MPAESGYSTPTSSVPSPQKQDLDVVRQQAGIAASEAGLEGTARELAINQAVTNAEAFNSLLDYISAGIKTSSGAESSNQVRPSVRREDVRVSIQMPERYTGSTDLSSWLRRYENTANSAGWDSRTKAERLGTYLADDYYESWDAYATKTDFAQDCKIMLNVLARCPTDATLERFQQLTWNGETNLAVFLARAKRILSEYNSKLPSDRQLSQASMDEMILDKLISMVPGAAKAELRRQRPSKVEDMVNIVSDYSPEAGVATSTLQQLEKRLDSKLQKVLAAVSRPLSESGQLEKLQQQVQALQQRGNGSKGRSFQRKCGICLGSHMTKDCPLKQFDSGCYLCGGSDHIARNCPKSLTKKSSGDSSRPSASGN
ncbi:hypothetical protein FOZ60_010223 [Perkinsus olseni]|uniref:CCHC-type domain-containing protein n=2 Tax=Perkinsus olseni TaxID=32597 RepID=A0A7J6NFT9_PEROL|nr:hypothetical protein FOZ60_010223 [Perkinsus olseni]